MSLLIDLSPLTHTETCLARNTCVPPSKIYSHLSFELLTNLPQSPTPHHMCRAFVNELVEEVKLRIELILQSAMMSSEITLKGHH